MRREASELGTLLKHWRGVRKLSQLALAHTAGVSAKHVAFLETARTQPSRDMVLLLADALDVPLRERNALLRAAGFADAYVERALDAPAIEPARRALEFVLARHEPYPALVIDAAWNLQLANVAARRLFAAFSSKATAARPNVLRMLFDPRGLRPCVENWAEISSALLSRLDRESRGASDSSPLRHLLAELSATPGTPRSHTPPRGDAAALPFIPLVLRKGELRLRLFSLISSFGTAVDLNLHELRIETLLPADELSGRLLREMADEAGSATAFEERPPPARVKRDG